MYLFKESVMFDAKYSYGEVKIHPCVIDQLENWIERKGKKYQKFGGKILNSVIKKASSYTLGIQEPTKEQYDRSIKIIKKIEEKLDDKDKSMAADEVDQDLLVLAYVNKAHLATQEKTMTNIGKKSLPAGRVVRFEHLAIELVKSGNIKAAEVEAGLQTLDYYKELLDSSLRAEILKLCQEDDPQ